MPTKKIKFARDCLVLVDSYSNLSKSKLTLRIFEWINIQY